MTYYFVLITKTAKTRSGHVGTLPLIEAQAYNQYGWYLLIMSPIKRSLIEFRTIKGMIKSWLFQSIYNKTCSEASTKQLMQWSMKVIMILWLPMDTGLL